MARVGRAIRTDNDRLRDRFIPLDAKTGPLRLIASAFRWHNETSLSNPKLVGQEHGEAEAFCPGHSQHPFPFHPLRTSRRLVHPSEPSYLVSAGKQGALTPCASFAVHPVQSSLFRSGPAGHLDHARLSRQRVGLSCFEVSAESSTGHQLSYRSRS